MLILVQHGLTARLEHTFDCAEDFLTESSRDGPQTHTRVVYSDVGRPLQSLCTFHSFFFHLARVVEGGRPVSVT